MKGILFGGCSFTWGQGLYYYSNLNRVPILENDYSYYPELIKESNIPKDLQHRLAYAWGWNNCIDEMKRLNKEDK